MSTNVLLTIKVICLFFAVWFTIINSVNWSRGKTITILNGLLQALGITGFVTLQWLL